MALDSKQRRTVERVIDRLQAAAGYASFGARSLDATLADLRDLVAALHTAVADLHDLATRKDG